MDADELLKHQVRTWSAEENSARDAVRINGVGISAREINVESANYEGGTIPERQHQAAIALAIRELLRQRALARGLLAGDAELDDAMVEELLDRELAIPHPDEATCRRYFQQNRGRFRAADRAEVRHILLPAHPRDLEERDQVRQQAQALIAELQREPGRFASLARQRSACPSRERGGSLGWIGPGQTVPELEDAVLRSPPGLVERPVESRYGWHVVEVLERQEGAPLAFAAVQEAIERYLVERSRSRATRQYLQLLVGEAEIEGLELASAATPLVQ